MDDERSSARSAIRSRGAGASGRGSSRTSCCSRRSPSWSSGRWSTCGRPATSRPASTTGSTPSRRSRPTRSSAGSTSRPATSSTSAAIPGFGDDARTFLDPAERRRRREPRRRRDPASRDARGRSSPKTADAEEIYHPRSRRQRSGCRRWPQHEGKTARPISRSSPTARRTRPCRTSYTSPLTQRPTITVATPLFDQNGGGQRVAVLAADLSLQRLDRIILERTGLGESGRTYPRRPRRAAHPGSHRRRGQAQRRSTPRASARSRAGQSGEGLYIDERGVPVIGVYHWIADRGAGTRRRAEPGRGVRFGPAAGLVIGAGRARLGASSSPAGSGSWRDASPGRSCSSPPRPAKVTGRRPRGRVRDPVRGRGRDARRGVRRDDRRAPRRTSRPSSGGSRTGRRARSAEVVLRVAGRGQSGRDRHDGSR